MTIWFTGDTHFGHSAMLRHGRGQFPDLYEHDVTLIKNWNRVVKPGDMVIHVGDFAWHGAANYRSQLNGQIHLVRGNHDRENAEFRKLFASISDIKKVKVGEQTIYACHYAMRVWNRSHYGTWHVYGHSHGSLAEDPNALSMDVGMDCHNFTPISFDQVKEHMERKNWKPVDHHQGTP